MHTLVHRKHDVTIMTRVRSKGHRWFVRQAISFHQAFERKDAPRHSELAVITPRQQSTLIGRRSAACGRPGSSSNPMIEWCPLRSHFYARDTDADPVVCSHFIARNTNRVVHARLWSLRRLSIETVGKGSAIMVSRDTLGGAFRPCPSTIGFAGIGNIRSPKHVGQFHVETSHTIKSVPSTNSRNNREAVCVDLGGGIPFGMDVWVLQYRMLLTKISSITQSNTSTKGCCCSCCCRRRRPRQPLSPPEPTYNSMFAAATTEQTMGSPLARATSTASIGSTTITSWKWLDEFTVTADDDDDVPEEKVVVPAVAFAKPPQPQQVKNTCGVAEKKKKVKNQKKQPAAKPVTASRRPVPQTRALAERTKAACTTPAERQESRALDSNDSNNNEDYDEPCLDEWQRTYAAFITRPSTHISTLTGQPIARRSLNTWGRQHYKPRRGSASTTAPKGKDFHDNSFYHHNSTTTDGPTMIYLRGHVALSFATEEETIAHGEWLAAQRALYQSRPPPPAPPGIVAFDDDNDDARAHVLASIRTSKRATYAYMKRTVRFILLEQLGIDLSIPPTTTLFRHYNRSPGVLAF
jgi:hypothetical protein